MSYPNLKTQAVAGFTLLSFLGGPVCFALPTAKKANSPLSKYQANIIAKNPSLHGVQLFEDHDTTSVLYVSPATKKSQAGVLSFIGSPAQCAMLEDQYKITYLVPTGNYTEAAKAGSVSPFFDSTFGNAVAGNALLRKLMEKMQKADEIKNDHAAEFQAFTTTKSAHDLAVTEVGSAQAVVDSLNNSVTAASLAFTGALTPEALAAAKEALQAAQEARAQQLPAAAKRLATALSREYSTRDAYNKAYGAWAPFAPDLAQYTLQATSIQDVLKTITDNSAAAFTTGEKTLHAFEERPIGAASASYQIWDNEVNDVNLALQSGGAHDSYVTLGKQARPLPIYDIALASPTFLSYTSASSKTPEIQAGLGSQSNMIKGADQASVGSESNSSPEKTTFRDAEGKTIRIRGSELKDQGAGTFNAIVSQGAFCMGTSNREANAAAFKDSDGSQLNGYQYRPRSTNVLAQSVALKYKYYLQAEPVGVHCQMKFSQFSSFARSAGTESFLFWSNSWDDTTRSKATENGLTCSVTNKPTGLNQEDQTAYINALQDSAMRDIMAEYVLNFAKSWTTSTLTDNLKIANNSAAFNATGSAMLMLCGGNPYCMVGGIIWKSADELFGHNHGSTSSSDSVKGTISRDFNIDTWVPGMGETTIDLTVSL